MQTLPACTAILADQYPSVNNSSDASDITVGFRYLSELSPKDRPWDIHRYQADQVSSIYLEENPTPQASARLGLWTPGDFHRLGVRMRSCTDFLGFVTTRTAEGEIVSVWLNKALFCRVRHCPVCQWRRSKMWRARFLKALPGIQLAYPTSRWLFMTITWRNVAICDLKKSLVAANESFHRLRKRKEFSSVQGWIRTTEVTRNPDDGSAHPHFHVLLMVPSNYFGKNYVRQSSWVEAWRAARRVGDDDGNVHIEAVQGGIHGALPEVLKYSVKPSDMTADHAWFKELTRQVFKLRFIASGGVLKDVLKDSQETNEQLMLLNPDSSEAMKLPDLWVDWVRNNCNRYVVDSSSNASVTPRGLIADPLKPR